MDNPVCTRAEPASGGVSIVVVCHNEASVIERALDHVLAAARMLPAPEVLVVCGAPTDGTEKLAAYHSFDVPAKVIVLESNLGVSALRNAGYSIARNDIVAFVDGHMLLLTAALGAQGSHTGRRRR